MTVRRNLLLLLTGALPLLGGCIAHDARITAPAEGADAHGSTALGNTVIPSPPGPPPLTTVSDPLPREVTVSAWRSTDDGTLLRAEQVVLTPLPWWQRFPCDVVTDLLPYTVHAEATVAMALEPVPQRSAADLAREAAAAGYGPAVSGPATAQPAPAPASNAAAHTP